MAHIWSLTAIIIGFDLYFELASSGEGINTTAARPKKERSR